MTNKRTVKFTTANNLYESNKLVSHHEKLTVFEKRFREPIFGQKDQADVFMLTLFGDERNENGNLRWRGNVKEYYGLTLDVDNDKHDYLPMKMALSFLSDFYYIAYTTFKSTPELNRYRIVIPFAKPIDKGHLVDVYEYFLNLLSSVDSVDPGSKSISRPFVLPVWNPKKPLEYICRINDSIKTFFDPTNLLANIPLKELQVKSKPQAKADYFSSDLPTVAIDGLKIAPRIKALIKSGDATRFKGDRSSLIYYIVKHLIGRGMTDITIGSILLNKKYGIGDHYFEMNNPQKSALNDIQRIRTKQPKKKLIEGVEAHFKLKKTVSVNTAINQLESDVEWWIKNLPRDRAILAPAGIGKTQAILSTIKKYSSDRTYEIYVPDHALGNQLCRKLLDIDPEIKAKVIQGRSFKKDALDLPLCKRNNEAELISDYGYSIFNSLCKGCPHYESCAYLAQFSEDTQVTIFPHARLRLERGLLDGKIPDAAIIDESFYPSMLNIQESSLELVERYVKDDLLRKILMDSLLKNKPLLANLRSGFGDKVSSVLQKVSNEILPKQPKITGEMTEDEIERILSKQYNVKEKRILSRMLNQLMLEIEKFPTRQQAATVRLVGNKVTIVGRHELTRFTKKSKSSAVVTHVPVLCIDADFCKKIARLFFPLIKARVLRVERNAHITQIYSATNSRMRFYPKQKPTEKQLVALQEHIQHINETIAMVVAKHGKTLVIGYKFLLHGNKRTKNKPVFKPDGQYEFAYFGGLRGSNNYEDCNAVVVIGRNQIPIDSAESQAAALFWDGDQELNLTGKVEKEMRGFRLKEGLKGLKVDVCMDDQAQLIMELLRERESLQGIDRIRLIRNIQLKHVYLLCNLPLDITVDCLVHFKHVRTNKRPAIESSLKLFTQAFKRQKTGVLPINPSYLLEKHSAIFDTIKNTSNALKEAGFAGSWGTFSLNSSTYIKLLYNKWNLILFHAHGKSKKPWKALVHKDHSKEETMQILSKIFGVRITIVNVLIRCYRMEDIRPIPSDIDLFAEEYYNSNLEYNPDVNEWCAVLIK